jgi:outer membrane protein assembly factor BamD
MRLRLVAVLLPIVLLAACSHVAGEVTYGKSAEDDYRAGEEAAKKHSYVDANKFFEHVRNKYPFSKYAALAELRLADLKYDQDRFLEAAEAYQSFVRLHPSHDDVDYAAFRAGLSHWKEGPSDFLLFPPSFERDPVQARDTVKALDDFATKYPKSKYGPEAAKVLAEARQRLIDHEWYAAEFYSKRRHWAGAAGRLEGIVKNYPGSAREPEALLTLAGLYVKMDERFRAQQALQQLIVKHPQDPRRAEAEKMLASLR